MELVEEGVAVLEVFVLGEVETLDLPICVGRFLSAAALVAFSLVTRSTASFSFSPTQFRGGLGRSAYTSPPDLVPPEPLAPHPTSQHDRRLLRIPSTFEPSYSSSFCCRSVPYRVRTIRRQKRRHEPRGQPVDTASQRAREQDLRRLGRQAEVGLECLWDSVA